MAGLSDLLSGFNSPDDYRMVMARALMNRPQTNNPYDYSGAMNGLTSGLLAYSYNQDQKAKKDQKTKTMAEALRAMQGGQTDAAGPNPDGSAGYTLSKPTQGNPAAAVNILSSNPDTADQGWNLALGNAKDAQTDARWQKQFDAQQAAQTKQEAGRQAFQEKMARLQSDLVSGRQKPEALQIIPDPANPGKYIYGVPKEGMAADNPSAPPGGGDQGTFIEDMGRSIALGKAKMPTGYQATQPIYQAALKKAYELNPNLDQTTYDKRLAAVKNFDSNGEAGRNIRAIETAVGHMLEAGEHADLLGNGEKPLLNRVKNAWDSNWNGSSIPGNFDLAAGRALDEANKAFVGAPGSMAEREELKRKLTSTSSPEQIYGGMSTLGNMLTSRISALKTQYKRATGEDAPADLIDPQVVARLNAINERYAKFRPDAVKQDQKPQSGLPDISDLMQKYGSQ